MNLFRLSHIIHLFKTQEQFIWFAFILFNSCRFLDSGGELVLIPLMMTSTN